MINEELAKLTIEEFSRVQKWMLSVDSGGEAYGLMHDRYEELKVILAALNVNLTELDKIK